MTAISRRGGRMRGNPVKAALARGERVFGTLVFEFFTPGIAQIMAAAGAQFAIFDMEHGGVGIETIKQQMAYARFTSCTPLIRVPAVDYTPVAAGLDAGALGVMAPMVESAEQARLLVASTRYPPHGRRGAAFGVAHDDYEGGPVAEKMRAANERALVIALIETAPGVAAVDEIAAVPGIDVLWLGHFDLTNSMGIPGQFEHPDYLAAVRRILDAAARHGQAAGMMAADEEWARRYLRMGFRMMAYGLDHQVFQAALARGIAAMRGM
jgi:2-dehydro-3-deoxyglucarate aldolase/4-hydroxy-2-oxoheptanedioate aldolase